MTLWGGRFGGKLDPQAWALNASLGFDRRLARQDVRGSQAWAKALEKAGVLSQEEGVQILSGLERIQGEFERQEFVFQESDEDIHTAVERRLGELAGPVAGKLHTGRSRNDQVATDLRLWLLEAIQNLEAALVGLQSVLVERAETDLNILLPGYTHLQRAQPILLGHWWLSHFWPLQRDRERLSQLGARTASLPLGSGALAGTTFPVDRMALAADLGFSQPSDNSLDAVSDRDFVAEFLFCAALIGTHLSKLSESVVLFSSAEFGFFELSDAFSTGSSLMPQKKNPDVFELTRGKAGTLLGYLAGWMATLKGLPSTYDKDLQEDKVPVFNAYDTLLGVLPVLAGALQTLILHPERMRAAIDSGMLATDLADYLVLKGLPFRQAHGIAGQAIQMAGKSGKSLEMLTLAEFQGLSSLIDQDVYRVFDPQQSVARRNVPGGTAPEAVKMQLQNAKSRIQQA
ncbi:MAG TPA: argininosuccinate lyase [Anaerolineales bacterium]|nr:argininosuccinate lyase [Anaerolineales bacterium]